MRVARPVDSTPHTLLLASGMVSLASGRVIAERKQGRYQISRLTSFGDTSTRLKPRPVTFTRGQRTVELCGLVAELGADAYIVVASAGDRLRVAISGFPAERLWLRVSRPGSKTFLDGAAPARGGKGDSLWEARLTGEYLIEAVRRAPYCEPPAINHLLSLSLTAQHSR